MLDMDKADSMVDLYFEYVEEFPDDTLSVRYLFKAAELQMGMNKNLECINTLTKLQDNYPDCGIMPMVLHFKAFVYDDKFQDFDKARACLDELITKYPNDPLVPNAKAYREMIGKDPNEVFRQNDSLNN
jgi:TolA-binding protein